MQTFLPLPSFAHSAACLDRARLGKQRIENQQIMRAVAMPDGPETGWINHPATRMWRATPAALALYSQFCFLEWEARGYANGMQRPYDASWSVNADYPYAHFVKPLAEVGMPAWLGDEAFHSSHRSNLLRKDADWYGQFGWTEDSAVEYVWPVT